MFMCVYLNYEHCRMFVVYITLRLFVGRRTIGSQMAERRTRVRCLLGSRGFSKHIVDLIWNVLLDGHHRDCVRTGNDYGIEVYDLSIGRSPFLHSRRFFILFFE
ncbi:uncharacterized protein LOC126670099 [Mercurialis annua]|uniref:uncharacterized protein LOC126670099 n=1 Tax=Mercurialis annua TaxID=3986 RepID=UPI00215EFDB6|nr:uncharacterized protein LOC126670099 [Mercurialis annua]